MKSPKASRRRGVVLTPQGRQKLQAAKRQAEIQDNFGDRYTLEELSERTRLSLNTITKVIECQVAVDKQTLECFFAAFHLDLERGDYSQPNPDASQSASSLVLNNTTTTHQDWGEAIDVSVFYGRAVELHQLEQWLIPHRCRLVALLGMGGIGKTALSVKLAQQLQDKFEYLIWRSLRNAPLLEDLLGEITQFLSRQSLTNCPKTLNSQIFQLIDYLRQHRCLIVLDNFESVLQGGGATGNYRVGYESYGELLRSVGEAAHQSCLVLTSREKPEGVVALEGETLPVRTLHLTGLQQSEGIGILTAKGLAVTTEQCQELIRRYSGNPLALKIVSTSIRELFDGNVGEFLAHGTTIFNGLRQLLAQQFDRLTDFEQQVMYWLAIEREPVTAKELSKNIVPPVATPKLLETLASLLRRSLIEQSCGKFTQQPVVMEYATEQLIERICDEVVRQELTLLRSHLLLKAQAPDYVRETQARLILQPTLDELLRRLGTKSLIEQQLRQILAQQQQRSPRQPGYVGGNSLNLLSHLDTDLSGQDLSHLTIWQAYLQDVNLHRVNFAGSDLATSVFRQTFGSVVCIAWSQDGKFLATGDDRGEIHLWQVADGQPLLTFKGHTSCVWSVSFSPDGQTLASGSDDQTIRLWDIHTGQCLRTLLGHTNWILSVSFSPDGQTLASGSHDCTIRLWQVSTGRCRQILPIANQVWSVAFSPNGQILAGGSHNCQIWLWDVNTGQLQTWAGHNNRILSVAFSPDGQTLASGSHDHTIRLWDVSTGQCLRTLSGHTNWVLSVGFSLDGQTLASGSHDHTIRLWDVSNGNCYKVLQGHTNWIWSIAFSPDGQTLASGSHDQTIKLWDISTGQCLRTLQGHANSVRSIAFSPDGQTLASGSHDHTIRLWDASTGQYLRTLVGHTNLVLSVVFHPQGQILASGSHDHTIRLWDVNTGQCYRVLREHYSQVWTVDFSLDGQTLASGGQAQTIKLWDIDSGQQCTVLPGHTNWVWSVAFSPNGRILASGSHDHTVRLWDLSTQQCFQVLHGHTSQVWAVAFSPDRQILASASADETVKLWELSSGKCWKTLQGHASWVCSVAFSPDGQLLASGSHDHTVKLWDISTGKCLNTFLGHTNWVWAVAFNPDGQSLASGSADETIRIWQINHGKCLNVLRANRPYEQMNIAGVTGLTAAQKSTLKALGAIENLAV